MEDEALLFMQALQEFTHLWPQHTFHRTLLRRHDVYFSPRARSAAATSSPMKLAPHYDRTPRARSTCDDGAAVGQCAKGMHMRQIHAWNRQPDRFRSRGEQ